LCDITRPDLLIEIKPNLGGDAGLIADVNLYLSGAINGN
jgi:hypothetical protein